MTRRQKDCGIYIAGMGEVDTELQLAGNACFRRLHVGERQ
jgi:hypothetical protein